MNIIAYIYANNPEEGATVAIASAIHQSFAK